MRTFMKLYIRPLQKLDFSLGSTLILGSFLEKSIMAKAYNVPVEEKELGASAGMTARSGLGRCDRISRKEQLNTTIGGGR
jgi:hypothetical protein